MNKDEIISILAERTRNKKAVVREVIEEFMNVVVEGALRDGSTRFGKHIFKKKINAPRLARNPHTGEQVQGGEKTRVAYSLII